MILSETILCSETLVNFIEQRQFTTQQERHQICAEEKFEKESCSKSKQVTVMDIFLKKIAVSALFSVSADLVAASPVE